MTFQWDPWLDTSYTPIILEQDKCIVLKQNKDITMTFNNALVVKLVDTKDLKYTKANF